jgi:hypothetical protein
MNRFGWLLGISLSMAVGLASACKESHEGGDTQTNWLKDCTSSDQCGEFECICGRCTQSCQADDDCQTTPVATVCQAAASEAAHALCGDAAPPSGICLEPPLTMTPAPASDVADFCQRFVQSYCAYTERCGCGAAVAEQCRTTLASTCQPGGLLDAVGVAVAAGDLKYDAAAGDALLARLEEPAAPCVEETFRNLHLTSDELYSWAGTFTGTKALGAACKSPVGYKGGFNDCAEGVCAGADIADEGAGGTCIALVGLGDACDASGDQNLKATTGRLCFDARPADSDGEYESAFDSLSCAPGGAAGNVCARGLAVGQACNGREACSSGRCQSTGVQMGVCAELLADGQSCISGSDCLSGSCPSAPTGMPVCAPPSADGQPCALGSQCLSGGCYDNGAGSQVCAAPLARAMGEACANDFDCTTQVCRMGTCWADICGDYLEP